MKHTWLTSFLEYDLNSRVLVSFSHFYFFYFLMFCRSFRNLKKTIKWWKGILLLDAIVRHRHLKKRYRNFYCFMNPQKVNFMMHTSTKSRAQETTERQNLTLIIKLWNDWKLKRLKRKTNALSSSSKNYKNGAVDYGSRERSKLLLNECLPPLGAPLLVQSLNRIDSQNLPAII